MQNNHDRYLSIVQRARKRYQESDGRIVISTNGAPSIYARIEEMAWRKLIRTVERDSEGCLVFRPTR